MARRFDGKGLAGFIQKPYKTSALLEKIKEVIGPVNGPLRTTGSGSVRTKFQGITGLMPEGANQ